MPAAQARIVVIRGGAIGDFVLTLPALAALRQQFPQARLEVLGYAPIAQLALAGGLADAVRAIEARPLAGFFARQGELAEELQEYFGGCAVILSYLYDPDEIFQGNVARCSKAQFIAGPHRPDDTASVHATQVFLKPLERLAIFDSDPVPRLKVPKAAAPARAVAAKAARWLALHPGSGSERKNWPVANWTELLQRLHRETTWQLLLVGGEAEGDRLKQLARDVPPARVEIADQVALPKLAGRLAACDAFLGHDSGISHLAAAVGLPTLVLWGDTVQAVWRPLGENVVTLHEPAGLARLPVAAVLQAVKQMIP